MTLLPVLLPDGFVSKLSVGDKLTAGDTIAEKKGSSEEYVIHVTQALKVSPKDIQKYLKKNLGDSVSEEDVVAVKKAALGLSSLEVISKSKGTVVKIDEETGDLILKSFGGEKAVTLVSPVDATVDFCNNEKVVLKTDKQALIAEDALGKEKTGDLLYIADFDPSRLSAKVEDKIILTKTIDKLSLFKALGLDAAGVIIEDLQDIDFIDLSEKAITAPIFVVNEENFKKLSKAGDKKVFLDSKNKSIVIL